MPNSFKQMAITMEEFVRVLKEKESNNVKTFGVIVLKDEKLFFHTKGEYIPLDMFNTNNLGKEIIAQITKMLLKDEENERF